MKEQLSRHEFKQVRNKFSFCGNGRRMGRGLLLFSVSLKTAPNLVAYLGRDVFSLIFLIARTHASRTPVEGVT